jgi:hypothetical protein
VSLQICDREIDVISIIDDDPAAREVYELPIEDLDVSPYIEERGPMHDVEAFVNETIKRSQAVFCDYHLKVKNYSAFNGAELVAAYYRNHIPAVLCTKWEDAMLDEIRDYRRYIPSLLRPAEVNPDAIYESLKICINELNGKFLSTRKPWRTLVRIEEVVADENDQHSLVFVVVPGWGPERVVRLRFGSIPVRLRDSIRTGVRLFVHANIGAERLEDLYFNDWELP